MKLFVFALGMASLFCVLVTATSCVFQETHASALHTAVAQGDVKEVTALLRANPALVHQSGNDIFGRMPIHTAAISGQTKVGEVLLSWGAMREAQDSRGNTPLHLAATEGHQSFVDMILSKKCNVDAKNKNSTTALISASRKGNEGVVRSLIKSGASLGARNQFGSALHAAIKSNHAKVVEILLMAGCETTQKTSDGYSCVDLASFCGHKRIAEIMINNGGKPSPFFFAAFRDPNEIELAAKANEWNLPDVKDGEEYGLLHYAAMHGSPKMVEYLIAIGTPTQRPNKSKQAPIHLAAISGNVQKVQCLMEKNTINLIDYLNRTPLYYAIYSDDLKVAETLLLGGADPNMSDYSNQSPLAIARRNRNDECVALLMKHGAK